MFIGNERHVRGSQTAPKAAHETMNIDNEVLSAVQQEYSRMDEEHARIRTEALAAHNPQQHHRTRLTINPDLAYDL